MASQYLRDFILVFIAMLPSRNYVTQILRLLYETGGIDLKTYQQMYRGITDPDMEELLKRLGVVFDKDYIRLKYMSPGWILASLYDDLFKIFSDEEFRKRLSELTEIEIYDPFEEWLYIKIDTILKDPAHGLSARVLLKELLSRNTVTSKELVEKGLTPGEAYAVADALKYLGIVEHIDGVVRLSTTLIEKRDVFERVLKRIGIA